MKQILHIFKKDTRRFWPEILLSVILGVFFAIHVPAQWRIYEDWNRRQQLLGFVTAFGVLMPVSWWFLIARAIHAETLVGDRQFWVTRPYEWKDLLAAKVLLVMVWIGLPYLVVQSIILSEAGFHPLPYLPGMLANLLLFSTIFVLPTFSIAAVTSNFARFTMTLISCILVLVGFEALVNLPHGYTPYIPYPNGLWLPLLFCGCVAAIVLQYALRRTGLTRILLIALVVVLAITVGAYRSQSLVDRAYPQPATGSAQPLIVSHTPDNHRPDEARIWNGDAFIDLPIEYSGVQDGYAVFPNNFRFTLTAADGSQWTSPWQMLFSGRLLPGKRGSVISLRLKPELFDKFKSAPVTVQITFAVSRYQAEETSTTVFPSHDVEIPGIGWCTPGLSRAATASNFPHLICRSAIQAPKLTYATALYSTIPCSGPATTPAATSVGEAWIVPTTQDFALTSVWTSNILFRRLEGGDGEPSERQWHLCRGTPTTFTPYHLLDRTQVSMTIPKFTLPQITQ